MARTNHRFLKNRSELFFARGLDDPNQLESAYEIRFCAHAVLGVIETYEKAMAHQNRTDLPDRGWAKNLPSLETIPINCGL